jgi:hypothetical protein
MNAARARQSVRYVALFSLAATGVVFAASSFPTGDYDAGAVTLSFGSGGKFRVLQGAGVMVEGTFKTEGDKLVLTDVSGPYACPAEQKAGTYAWHVEGNALTLTKVDDACDDRSADLTGHPWQKK